MPITDNITDNIHIEKGGLRFRKSYTFVGMRVSFVCPVCTVSVDCGPSNCTTSLKVASERKREHEARHTAEFYEAKDKP